MEDSAATRPALAGSYPATRLNVNFSRFAFPFNIRLLPRVLPSSLSATQPPAIRNLTHCVFVGKCKVCTTHPQPIQRACLTGNVVPRKGLRVRAPCPPLQKSLCCLA